MASCTTVVFPFSVYATVSSVWLSLSGNPKMGGGIASVGAAARATLVMMRVNNILNLSSVPSSDSENRGQLLSPKHTYLHIYIYTNPDVASHLLGH